MAGSRAREITKHLGGDWHSHYGTVPGPGHSADDRSVTVRDHQTDPCDVVIRSFAGDDEIAIKKDWRARGLLPRRSQIDRTAETVAQAKIAPAHQKDVDESNVRTAWWLWHKISQPAQGTVVETYLKWRGISLNHFPPTIRLLPANDRHPHPAMIAAAGLAAEPFCGEYLLEPNQFRGAHLTYLQTNGHGKADVNPPRRMLGRIKGSPICLIPPNDGNGLIIAEGIESALAGYQASGLGSWAAGAANFMPALADAVPDFIESVTVFIEEDLAGRRGAEELVGRLAARGIEVLEWRAN